MGTGYWVAMAVGLLLFGLTLGSGYYGWGLTSDAQAMARSRTVRAGGLHLRHHYGGGPGFGK